METEIGYNLSAIPGFDDCIKNKKVNEECEKYYTISEYFTKSNEKFYIIKYCKEFMSTDLVNSYGFLRSIIINSAGKIVSFSPQKSQNPESFMATVPGNQTTNLYAEEFVEGTMINVFFNPNCGISGCWQIATRNTVGGEVSFFTWETKQTFNAMFTEACMINKFNINTLNPAYCYSFVMQHQNNRIVCPIKSPQLYLVSVYRIEHNSNEDIRIYEQSLNEVKKNGMWSTTGIKFPERYEFTSYSDLINKYASPNTSYDIMGVIIKNNETGERTKIRNPIYEEIKYLRGNQPKLQYQYLTLRKEGKLPQYLKYYPEMKEQMSKYRDQVHMFTNTLHQNYIACYVRKEKPLNEYPSQYRTHMFNLHQIFINELKEKKLYVTNTVVINYVNNLHPSLLMFCLNYNMRKKMIDTIKVNSDNDHAFSYFA